MSDAAGVMDESDLVTRTTPRKLVCQCLFPTMQTEQDWLNAG